MVVANSSRLVQVCTVLNKYGLHIRSARAVVKSLEKTNCRVFFSIGGTRADATSILELLTLAASKGSKIKVEVEGLEAEDTMAMIQEMFASHFGE